MKYFYILLLLLISLNFYSQKISHFETISEKSEIFDKDFNRKLNNWQYYQYKINDCRIVAVSFGILSIITYDIESRSYNNKYPLTYFNIAMGSFFLTKSFYLQRKQTKILKY